MNYRSCRIACLFVISILLVAIARADETGSGTFDPPLGTGKFVMIDFENVPVGQVPPGVTKTGDVAVVDDVAHTGHKSLRMGPAEKGGRKITLKGEVLNALAGEHWGRLYFKVKLPAPLPKEGGKVIHSTIVSGTAISPLAKDPIEVRPLGIVESAKGDFQYLYNVQPQKRKEFGKGTKAEYHFSDGWTLAEWHVDYATQTFQLFINGQKIKAASFSNGAGNFEKAEIPEVFQTLSFGWTNYQPASGQGFTAWIDDIALGKDRIGDRGLIPESKKPHQK